MKQLIVFPGNSEENRTWGETMAEHYAPHVDAVDVVSYDHWETGDPMIDFERELEKLSERYSTMPLDGTVYVIAKSSGALLALKAIAQKVLQPQHVVCFGIPFDLAEQFTILGCGMTDLVHVSVPVTAIHNQHDPVADYRYTTAVLAQHLPAATLITTTETDHWYGDTDRYDPIITPILGGG